VVADCLNHGFAVGLATRRAVGLELMPKSVGFCREQLDLARQRAKTLLDSSLVGTAWMPDMMFLELVGQRNS